jgi:hypothetical protein
MLSDELFFKAELNRKFGLKTCKKWPGAPVIDIAFFSDTTPSGIESGNRLPSIATTKLL